MRLIARLLVFLTVAAVAYTSPSPFTGDFGLGVTAAHAERPQTLLELFRRNRERATPPRQVEPPRRAAPAAQPSTPSRNVQRAPRQAAPAQIVAPPVAVVDKSENARRVLIVGDFVADGTGEGLVEAFADVASVIVERRVNGSSGLVRDDYFNWPQEIVPIVEEVKPDILVIQIGSNDRQVMRVEGVTEQVRSDAWTAEYKRRIDAFLDAAAQANIPVVWVSAPAYKFRTMTADMLAFNEMYRTAIEARRGYFVDLWDGFVNEEGQFITSGPDIKGQTVRLRANDGINFTSAGKRKMALYVERQLKLLLGDDAAPLLTSLAPEGLPILRLPPLQTESELVRTNPIKITDPELDGGAVLLGDMSAVIANGGGAADNGNPLQVRSVRQRLVENGTPPPPQPGRLGNYRVQALPSGAGPRLVLPATPPDF